MKALALVWLVGACSYSPASAPGDASTRDDAAADGPTEPDGPAVSIPPCSAVDPSGLVLCLEMEDGVADGTLLDSAPGHHHATAEHVTAATRTLPATSPAAEIGPTTSIRIAEHAALDRDAGYTLALWVRPNTLPQIGEVYGLADHEQQFAMLVGRSTADGQLENRCVHTGVARYEYTSALPEDAWSFLACTWDGTELCALRWSSNTDTERFCHQPTQGPNATGAQGLSVGHLSEAGVPTFRFDGALDSVQLYDRALTADQLCSQLGKPAGCLPCTAGCE